MKKLRFAKFCIGFVGTLVVLISVVHYQPAFAKMEYAGWRNEVSWLMGIIFDLPGLLFFFYYTRMPSKAKHFLGISLLFLIGFFHWLYYTQAEPTLFIFLLLSAVWPYMIGLVTFMAYQIRQIESGKAEAKPEKAEEKVKFNGSLPPMKSEPKAEPVKKKRQSPKATRSIGNMKPKPVSMNALDVNKTLKELTDSMRTGGGGALKNEVENE